MKNPGDEIHCRCGVEFFVPKLPNIARSWNCPSCGGGVDPNENRCEYCDSYIAFARCPACFSIAPYDGAKHCGECGDLLTLPIKTILDKKTEQPCPRCESSLQNKVVNSNLVEYCNDCGGVWLGHHLFDDLLKNEPPNATAALGLRPSPKGSELPRHEVSYLRCPECDVTMSRHNFMSNSGIIIDQCSDHGVWFDKHELAAGLDYARSSKNKTKKSKTKKNDLEDSSVNELITKRRHDEVFEIEEEDLTLLLDEFPHWVSKK